MVRKSIFNFILLATMICFIFSFGCTGTNNEGGMSTAELTDEVAKLKHEIHRLWAVSEVQNLMTKYAMWHTAGMNYKTVDIFSKADDAVVEMLWGRYTGSDAAYRCWAVDHRGDDTPTILALDLDVPPIPEEYQREKSRGTAADDAGGESRALGKGAQTNQPVGVGVHYHPPNMPAIVVAEDGQTARGVWTMNGVEAGKWAFGKYACDFKIENGRWVIWHLHVYGFLWQKDYYTSWGETESFTPVTEARRSADKPPTTNWKWSQEATYIPLEPAPPEPYETWGKDMYPASYGVVD